MDFLNSRADLEKRRRRRLIDGLGARVKDRLRNAEMLYGTKERR